MFATSQIHNNLTEFTYIIRNNIMIKINGGLPKGTVHGVKATTNK